MESKKMPDLSTKCYFNSIASLTWCKCLVRLEKKIRDFFTYFWCF